MTILSKLKKFLFEPTDQDKERIERWKNETDKSNDKLTIEDFDTEEVQVTKHMSVKQKKSKPVKYNF